MGPPWVPKGSPMGPPGGAMGPQRPTLGPHGIHPGVSWAPTPGIPRAPKMHFRGPWAPKNELFSKYYFWKYFLVNFDGFYNEKQGKYAFLKNCTNFEKMCIFDDDDDDVQT